MKNITIETNYVRVIGNTKSPDIKEMNEMIGQELEVHDSDYSDDKIAVWNKDKDWFKFSKKDVRFLTAGMFKGKHIAIDDEVFADGEWKKVLGFYMWDGKVRILTGRLENTCWYYESDIKDHRTELSLSGKQVTVTIDGKDYQAVIK